MIEDSNDGLQRRAGRGLGMPDSACRMAGADRVRGAAVPDGGTAMRANDRPTPEQHQVDALDMVNAASELLATRRRLRQAHAEILLHSRYRTRIEPLSVRDRQRRDRWHTAGQWVLLLLAVFASTVIGLAGSWDRQRMGERPTTAQERSEATP